MTWYNVGDIIECNSGDLALILSVEKMYRHPDSPPHSFEVQWLDKAPVWDLSLIHISEPTRPY